MAEPDVDRKTDDSGSSHSPNVAPVMDSADLFRGEREVCIRHDGELYRLRITRRGRLILQK